MNLNELKQKPLWQMTGEEFLYLQKTNENKEPEIVSLNNSTKKHVYGIANNQQSTNNQQLTTKESNSSNQIPTTYQPKTTENYGEGDFWVVKLSKEGKIEWQKNYGGSSDDHIRTLANTETGYIIAGESRSGNSGNKKSNIKEGTDLWVISLDENGNELWQKGYNFKNRDVLYNCFLQLHDMHFAKSF